MNKEERQKMYERYEELYQSLKKVVDSTELQVNLITTKDRPVNKVEIDKANSVIDANKNRATMLLGMVGITNRQCKILDLEKKIDDVKQLDLQHAEVVEEG